ncbi:MAG: M1 family metallopeptidase [Bacteroidota bacterium]|nr:M1 family metallopeptidase [Bacteroidota bacterium]
MKRFMLFCCALVLILTLHAQDVATENKDSALALYRASFPHINDLVNTKLDVKFDYSRSYLYGKAWITLKPHFYPTDSLSLDAKGMDIHEVSVLKSNSRSPLKYNYDGSTLNIHLDRTYHSKENYTVYIDYTSKPNELKSQGSAAITDAKGLYFINPLGKEKDKPTQIWTQGETESNSAWFPTIDKPDQKCTQEIIMTVPSKYVTLSNGKLISRRKNADGTRTDTWKMDQPNAPYLFFMGVGDYAIIKDSYKGKEVSYYVEKAYASVARKIFGLTPEMIAFYSRGLGVDFPWVKYAQMTARDYVSGAMENTTATLHTDALQQDARELTDGNKYEDYVAHELFHQWFGDLVTTESWSNLTLNESFANFSETLWAEYKHGKDAGDATNYQDIRKYLADPANPSKNLVRFHYADREDMFDMVTYSKGGRILNMLRNYVGDSAFFKSLNLYLTTNKFRSAEAQNLRLAFEEVTGQDLNWYWNQWYYGSGHPKLDIHYFYNDAKKTALVTVDQTQGTGKIFQVPLAIDVYEGTVKQRHKVWLSKLKDSFYFSYQNRPDLINVDGDKIVLCEKNDDKNLANFIFQYKHAGLYLDRREAIDFCSDHQNDPAALDLLKTALKDRYYGLRIYAINALDLDSPAVKAAVEPILSDLAHHDPNRNVQAAAIEQLGNYANPEYKTFFIQKASDSSYSVSGNALEALKVLDPDEAYRLAKQFADQPARGELLSAITDIFINAGDTSNQELVIKGYNKMLLNQDKINDLPHFAVSLLNVQNDEQFRRGIDAIIKLLHEIPANQKKEFTGAVNENILKPLAGRKDADGFKTQADYVRSKIE